MSIISLMGLFGAMLLLAIVPGPAVFAIIARSFSCGFSRGLYMTMGIAFVIIKYLSAAYLMWLGYKLLRTKANAVAIADAKPSSSLSNFIAGLVLTLGNPKAILFYVGFFPAFVDVANITYSDILLIMAVATIAFGSVNLCYAFMATKAKKVFKSPKAATIINKTAGFMMVSTGALVAIRS